MAVVSNELALTLAGLDDAWLSRTAVVRATIRGEMMTLGFGLAVGLLLAVSAAQG